jgi:nucleoside-diphosphate-sugar epimerase
MSLVLVLGASGFVGGAIVKALAQSGRHRPIAASRSAGNRPSAAGIVARACDATDATSVAGAAEGVSCIVNSVLGSDETMLAATRNVCAAAAAVPGARVVHLSSMAVYGPASGLVDEAAPLRGADPYSAAKIACERIIADFIAGGGDAVILRPGIVHGPGGEQWTGRLGRMLRQGRLGDLGELGDGRCNLTYIDDVGAAALAAVERRDAAGQAFHVADPDPPTWNQYLIGLGVLIGAVPVRRISPRRLRIETRLAAPPLQVLKLLAARAGMAPGALPEPIPPSLLRLFQQDMELDSRKAESGLAFARTEPTVALAASATWFRQRHRLENL